ncbi:hypothetical protein NP233_g7649 [Leucocoprinus birnbaumii]|uniref:F-box domain-containing protein n=1 Tax=Leucocoprinus birnbaumii TaxID=56174 RepID=A0AAD5VNS5_9AGAR|nr:hypothetical protein NP233_g7649 [Leucocoprinus birnbaumii]
MSDPSPVQRCLLATEVLDLICTEIWYSPRDSLEDRRGETLAALACTCRAWSDVALDRLWHDIRGISPLLCCLDLWEDANGSWTIKRPLTDSDRATFCRYASRVRRLLRVASSDEDTPAAHYALSLISDSCILPNLCRLEWDTQNPVAFHYIRQYLNPGLKELYISFLEQQQEQLNILFTIPAVFSPNIKSLQIRVKSASQSDPSRLSLTLPSWNHLFVLELPDLTFDGLSQVAQMRNLATLKLSRLSSLWITSGIGDRSSQHSRQPLKFAMFDPPFPVLQHLDIATSSAPMSAVIDLIRTFQAARLQSIKLFFCNKGDTLDDLDNLIQSLAGHCDLQSLRAFYYSHEYLAGSFASLIRPLLGFHNLRSFRLFNSHYLPISQAEATQIQKALPNIEQLVIDSHCKPQGEPMSNLLTLLPFTHCQKLKYLTVHIDASDKCAREQLRKRSSCFSDVRNYSLRKLDVGKAPISHKEFVASFLADVFPNLEEITFDDCQDTSCARRWHYVEEVLLPLLSRARMREQHRLGIKTPTAPEDFTANWGKRISVLLEADDEDWSDEEKVEASRSRLHALRSSNRLVPSFF